MKQNCHSVRYTLKVLKKMVKIIFYQVSIQALKLVSLVDRCDKFVVNFNQMVKVIPRNFLNDLTSISLEILDFMVLFIPLIMKIFSQGFHNFQN